LGFNEDFKSAAAQNAQVAQLGGDKRFGSVSFVRRRNDSNL